MLSKPADRVLARARETWVHVLASDRMVVRIEICPCGDQHAEESWILIPPSRVEGWTDYGAERYAEGLEEAAREADGYAYPLLALKLRERAATSLAEIGAPHAE